MKLQSSTLIVNTGRKPLPGMQKKKKNNKNNIVLGVCIAIIAVLCIFVGLIVHVWVSYDNETPSTESVVETNEVVVPETTPQPAEPVEEVVVPEEIPEPKKTPRKYKSTGEAMGYTKYVTKQFAKLTAEYSLGIMNMNHNSTYITNPERIENTAALAPFLAEYVSDAIYLGTFDYSTDVAGYKGSYLMDRAFGEGSVDAANLLIQHFGTDRLNNYFINEGYANTHFEGLVGTDGSYTTAEDLLKLMNKFYNNTGFFPYSDMYKKMLNNTCTNKIMKSLPAGVYGANLSFTFAEETVDAAIVYTSKGNFIFVAMAEGDEDELAEADKAMANSAKKICTSLE